MSRRHVAAAVAIVSVAATLLGCSGRGADKWRQRMPPTYAVKGSVTYKGKTLAGATVVFHPRDGISPSRRAATGLTDSTGRFVLTTLKPGDGAVAGSFLVTVEKTTPIVPGATATPLGDSAAYPLGPDPSAAKSLIPEKYFAPSSSGLTADVHPHGRNEVAFSLD